MRAHVLAGRLGVTMVFLLSLTILSGLLVARAAEPRPDASHLSFVPVVTSQHCSPFFDDFSNPRSGWFVGDNDFVRTAYVGGEFQALSKQAGYVFLFNAPTCNRDDYVVAADVRWEGTPGLALGLAFDVAGIFEQYYLFAINTDEQTFWLDYRGPGGWERVLGPLASNAIRPGQEQNHLAVRRQGNMIALEINDVPVSQLIRGVAGGGVGIAMAPHEDRAEADGRFDNFAARSLPPE